MNNALQVTMAHFDAKGLKYRQLDDEAMRVTIGGVPKIGDVDIIVIFGEDETDAALRCFNVCSFDKSKIEALYKACSVMNKKYRWVKFYVDEEREVIVAEDDAVIQLDGCGEEVEELVFRMLDVVKNAYPEFMRAIYA